MSIMRKDEAVWESLKNPEAFNRWLADLEEPLLQHASRMTVGEKLRAMRAAEASGTATEDEAA